MNHEMILHQFEDIEQKVDQLIEVRKNLEAENLHLKDKVDALELQLQSKVDAENSYALERETIGQKVAILLERLGLSTEVKKAPDDVPEEKSRWS